MVAELFEEFFVERAEVEATSKEVEELIKLVADEYEAVQEALMTLKEFVEGDLVEVLKDAVDVMCKAVGKLLDLIAELVGIIGDALRRYFSTDTENSQVVKDSTNAIKV